MMRGERHNKPMKWRDFAAQSKHYIIVKIMDNCSRLCVILGQFGSNIKTNGVVKGLYFPVWNYCLFGCSSLWKHHSSLRQIEGTRVLFLSHKALPYMSGRELPNISGSVREKGWIYFNLPYTSRTSPAHVRGRSAPSFRGRPEKLEVVTTPDILADTSSRLYFPCVQIRY